jgi:hypothetical protein
MWIWLLVGVLLGGLNGLMTYWTVSRLRPGAPPQSAMLILGGAPLRWGLVTVALILALRRGVGPALLTFAGLELTRWGLVILVGVRPDIFQINTDMQDLQIKRPTDAETLSNRS